MRTARPLLAAAALAIVASGAAYAFGPRADADPATGTPSRAALQPVGTCAPNPKYPKRQLRGVWIATVKNIDWPSRTGLTVARQQAEYVKLLDAAAARRFNAVFFQVRPASDAVYKSSLEPWSQYLTGTAGKDPGWDPLPFLIEEAHKRGLEFHAWFNPYRAAYDADTSKLPAAHPARVHPEWTVKYGDRLYYNPGLPEVRSHVVKVISDVVSRYDIDGVHFDDYFYPYPGGGATFDDSSAFRRHGGGKKLADWRRDNVNTLVAQVDKAVHGLKNHVKFGISPFGIWRNKAQDPTGSATSGMSAYDSIYADARHWIKSGTVDYIMPQLYWPRGFKIADYKVLVPWWAGAVKGTDVDLYIGQALYRVGTTDQAAWTKPGELPAHLTLNQAYKQVDGDVYFSAKQMLSNPLGVMDRLAAGHYKRPALLPLMKDRAGSSAPAAAKPSGVQASGAAVKWADAANARAYAVYRVPQGDAACASVDGRNLVAVTTTPGFTAPASGTYLVSSLNRLHEESKTTKVKVTLP
ncbi:glycoside hydrolase family 10 protein [Nonomuraea soli]|uniref:Uncharacterized lipoprotein YddW (UPF0748 family) n=1 Tax=Nonomuraea soli TaxID=1032476 RepID=A0A7W0CPV5_9ACTN|nr:family 10 glycosylhydrolase [Nonomuraea soli]MBA2895122.1 uncharacterized lipoprotein YddW (UPF0748 family) [Nonomuraea soli]